MKLRLSHFVDFWKTFLGSKHTNSQVCLQNLNKVEKDEYDVDRKPLSNLDRSLFYFDITNQLKYIKRESRANSTISHGHKNQKGTMF